MSVAMRFMRVGKLNRPYYRLCVFESRNARDGKYLECLGHYDPLIADAQKRLIIDRPRIEYWLGTGAMPSETVASFLRKLQFAGLARKPRPKRKRKPENAKTKKVSKDVIERAKLRAERTRERKAARAKAKARAAAAAEKATSA